MITRFLAWKSKIFCASSMYSGEPYSVFTHSWPHWSSIFTSSGGSSPGISPPSKSASVCVPAVSAASAASQRPQLWPQAWLEPQGTHCAVSPMPRER